MCALFGVPKLVVLILIVVDARREGDWAKYTESCDLYKRVERQMTTPTSDDVGRQIMLDNKSPCIYFQHYLYVPYSYTNILGGLYTSA